MAAPEVSQQVVGTCRGGNVGGNGASWFGEAFKLSSSSSSSCDSTTYDASLAGRQAAVCFAPPLSLVLESCKQNMRKDVYCPRRAPQQRVGLNAYHLMPNSRKDAGISRADAKKYLRYACGAHVCTPHHTACKEEGLLSCCKLSSVAPNVSYRVRSKKPHQQHAGHRACHRHQHRKHAAPCQNGTPHPSLLCIYPTMVPTQLPRVAAATAVPLQPKSSTTASCDDNHEHHPNPCDGLHTPTFPDMLTLRGSTPLTNLR